MTSEPVTGRTTGATSIGRPWARALGVTLVPTTPEVVEADAGLVRALADGIKRNRPLDIELPRDADWYLVRERGEAVGVAAIRRDVPAKGLATLVAVAVRPDRRGRAAGTKALLAAERRLQREGYAPMFTRVPRTNGRGLYFMLRCGFTPVPPPPAEAGDATWFKRGGSR